MTASDPKRTLANEEGIVELAEAIARIKSTAQDDAPTAILQATALIEAYPNEASVWSLRSYLYAREGQHGEAIDDLTRAMAILPGEPAMHFNRGRYSSVLGRYVEAIEDCSAGLACCDTHGSDYYRDGLHFLRAYANVKLGEKAAALRDLHLIADDDASLWVGGLITRRELVRLCG